MSRKTKAIAGVTAAATSGAQAQADQRREEAERQHDQQADPASASRAAGCRGSTVSIALASISGPDMSLSLVGVGCTSCSVGDAAPTTTTRPRTRAGSTRPLTQVGERDGVDGARRAVEVDPGAVLLGTTTALGGWPDAPRDDRGQRRQAAVLVLDALQHAAAALGQVARRRLARRCSCSNASPPSTLRAAVLVGLGGGEHDVVGRVDGVDERVVVARRRLLGELDVVDDHPRAGAAQAVDRLGVAAPREGPVIAAGRRTSCRRRRRRAGSAPGARRGARSAARSDSCSSPGSRRPRSAAPATPAAKMPATRMATARLRLRPVTFMRPSVWSARDSCGRRAPGRCGGDHGRRPTRCPC